MSAFQKWDKPMQKCAAVPGVVTKHMRRKAKEQALADAYKDVDTRDKGISWVSGKHTDFSPDPRTHRDRHHLKGRRVMPEWVSKPERIITVTREEHDLITAGWIVVEGTDARKPIFFHYAAHVKPHQKTVVIRRKNVRPEAE